MNASGSTPLPVGLRRRLSARPRPGSARLRPPARCQIARFRTARRGETGGSALAQVTVEPAEQHVEVGRSAALQAQRAEGEARTEPKDVESVRVAAGRWLRKRFPKRFQAGSGGR